MSDDDMSDTEIPSSPNWTVIQRSKTPKKSPTMARQPRSQRYRNLPEVPNIRGFVVNVHDAMNFDIDLDLSPQLAETYKHVTTKPYTYKDFGINMFKQYSYDMYETAPVRQSRTYKCRLIGIEVKPQASRQNWQIHKLSVEIDKIIDRTDGWVTCTLSDIDVYQRLLIDIDVHTTDGTINIRDYLLNQPQDIFHPYHRRKNSV